MSHHGIHLLPGLMPLQEPAKLKKKRRLRKARTSDIASAREAGSIDELFVMDAYYDDEPADGDSDELDTGRLILNSFAGATMRGMLQAQEEG
jgi:hypothetical protein